MKDPILNLIGLARRAGFVLMGTDTVIKNLTKANLIFLANDASTSTQDKIIKKSFYYHVPVIELYDSVKLSQAIGKAGIKLLAITDQGFSKKMLELMFKEKEVTLNEG